MDTTETDSTGAVDESGGTSGSSGSGDGEATGASTGPSSSDEAGEGPAGETSGTDTGTTSSGGSTSGPDATGQGATDDGWACTAEYDPVCGKDGETYDHPCSAIAAGVEIRHDGPCFGDCEGSCVVAPQGPTLLVLVLVVLAFVRPRRRPDSGRSVID